MYNQHTRGMVTTRHRSLFERGGRKAFVGDKEKRKKKALRKKKECQRKTGIHLSTERDSST